MYEDVTVNKEGEFAVKKEESNDDQSKLTQTEGKRWSEYTSESSDGSSGSKSSTGKKRRNKSKKDKRPKIPFPPPASAKVKNYWERMRQEHKPFDLCPPRAQQKATSPKTKAPKKKVTESISHPPIYPVFSNHELFDVGEVTERQNRRHISNEGSSSKSSLKMKGIRFVKEKVPYELDLSQPIRVNFSNRLYAKTSLGFDYPKPSDKIKDKKMLEDMGSFAKVFCTKCDAYGHHTDTCWFEEEKFEIPDIVSGVDMKSYKEMYSKYLSGEGKVSEDNKDSLVLDQMMKAAQRIKENVERTEQQMSLKGSKGKGKKKVKLGKLNGDEKFLLKQGFEPRGFQWKTKEKVEVIETILEVAEGSVKEQSITDSDSDCEIVYEEPPPVPQQPPELQTDQVCNSKSNKFSFVCVCRNCPRMGMTYGTWTVGAQDT